MHLPPDELRALTLEEFEALQVVLDLNPDGQWMNVEMIDGYFAALICAPTLASTGLRFGPVFGVEIFAEAALPALAQHRALQQSGVFAMSPSHFTAALIAVSWLLIRAVRMCWDGSKSAAVPRWYRLSERYAACELMLELVSTAGS